MVDYSKWDKFECSDSDEEDAKKSKNFSVTTLPKETGGKVTIGPQGYQIEEEEEEEDSLPSFAEVNRTILENERKKLGMSEENEDELPLEDEEEEEAERRFYEEQKQQYYQQQILKEKQRKEQSVVPTPSSSSDAVKEERKIEFVKSVSRSIDPSLRSRNGSRGVFQGLSYEWSQTRYEVTMYLYCSSESLKEKLSGSGEVDDVAALRKRDFHLLYRESDRQLTLSYRHRSLNKEDRETLVQGRLQYDVELTGDPDYPYDDVIDWEVTSMPSGEHHLPELRDKGDVLCFEVVMRKQQKFSNAIIWWKTVFQGEAEIDVSTIQDRSKNYAEFMQNFQTANQMFLEKLKNKEYEKVAIDIDS